jgi:hypothetical protein
MDRRTDGKRDDNTPSANLGCGVKIRANKTNFHNFMVNINTFLG